MQTDKVLGAPGTSSSGQSSSDRHPKPVPTELYNAAQSLDVSEADPGMALFLSQDGLEEHAQDNNIAGGGGNLNIAEGLELASSLEVTISEVKIFEQGD